MNYISYTFYFQSNINLILKWYNSYFHMLYHIIQNVIPLLLTLQLLIIEHQCPPVIPVYADIYVVHVDIDSCV